MITLSDRLPDGGLRGTAEIVGPDDTVECLYHKCPVSGDVTVAVDDPDEIPTNTTVLIKLNDHDDSPCSEYNGIFSEKGIFSPV